MKDQQILDPKLKSALAMAMAVLPEELGCDDAFEYFAAYAEHVLSGMPVPDRFQLVVNHLALCAFCREEFDRLLDALKPGALPD